MDDDEDAEIPSKGNTIPKETVSRSKLVLPPPKTSASSKEGDKLENVGDEEEKEATGASAAELELLRSVMGDTGESASGTSLFFIDTAGEDVAPKRRKKELQSFKY